VSKSAPTATEDWNTSGYRDWQSPIQFESIPGSYYPAFSTIDMAQQRADTQALNSLMDFPDGLRMAVINVKRDENGKPHYRYFTRPESYNSWTWHQTWSSSKFMKIAAAAARIRQESDGTVGFDSRVSNGTHVGRYISNVVKSINGNELAAWFSNVAGKEFTNRLVQDWIGSEESTLGAHYGLNPLPLGYTFTDVDTGAQEWTRNSQGSGAMNRVRPLAAAEWLKRLVMHREDQVTRMPGMRAPADAKEYWEDLKMLFYGAPSENPRNSGMSGVPGNDQVIRRSARDLGISLNGDNWRAFGKTGSGPSNTRGRWEFRFNGYGCFPDTSGNPVELVFSAYHADVNGYKGRNGLREDVKDMVTETMRSVINGNLDRAASPPTTGGEFVDLDGHWFDDEIRALADDGVVSGYGNGTIRPDRSVTRAEFAALLTSAFDLSGDRDITFSDIETEYPDDYWARDAIYEAAEAGFLSGYDDGTFRPERPVRKVEAMVSLSNGLGYSGGNKGSLPYIYEDADEIPDWAKQAVVDGVAGGLIDRNPFPLGDWLEPQADATRAEILQYIDNHRA
jgi:hypothetical protein